MRYSRNMSRMSVVIGCFMTTTKKFRDMAHNCFVYGFFVGRTSNLNIFLYARAKYHCPQMVPIKKNRPLYMLKTHG